MAGMLPLIEGRAHLFSIGDTMAPQLYFTRFLFNSFMPLLPKPSLSIAPSQARAIWLHAQRLDLTAPFGDGPEAVKRAVEHLGYVQIDTINVIERSHHHILRTRIPAYQKTDLAQAQASDKSVFEFWTHALAYTPSADYRLFMPAMNRFRADPHASFNQVEQRDYKALLRRIAIEGPLSIRDIDDDVLVEKTHPWGSRKPSRRALRYGFYSGDLTVSKRTGMLKTYDLSARHFGWARRPLPASDKQFAEYLLRRALQSQGMVSLDSICHGNTGLKSTVAALIDATVKRKKLLAVHLDGHPKMQHWIRPEALEQGMLASSSSSSSSLSSSAPLMHILSPFDPLIIQRKRLKLFFDYEHRFEAYVPAEKRVFGYFALPVLEGDRIVAVLDLKMDRQADKLLVQKWTWVARKQAALKASIDEALHRFERFQKA